MTKDEYEAFTALNLAVTRLTMVVTRTTLRFRPDSTDDAEAIDDLLGRAQDAADRAFEGTAGGSEQIIEIDEDGVVHPPGASVIRPVSRAEGRSFEGT